MEGSGKPLVDAVGTGGSKGMYFKHTLIFKCLGQNVHRLRELLSVYAGSVPFPR